MQSLRLATLTSAQPLRPVSRWECLVSIQVITAVVYDIGVQAVDFYRQDFTWEALTNIAWALAEVTHWTPKLADLAEALILRGGLRYIKNYHLVSLLWSFAVLDYNPASLIADTLPSHRGGWFSLLWYLLEMTLCISSGLSVVFCCFIVFLLSHTGVAAVITGLLAS